MTKREKETLEFLIKYHNEKGYSPTIAEICTGINTKSTQHVKIMLEHLRNENKIDFVNGQTRTITINN